MNEPSYKELKKLQAKRRKLKEKIFAKYGNRVKNERNNIFSQLVLLLADRGFISLDVEYIDGTKIESKANKYTFVWRRTVEKNRAKLQEKRRILPLQALRKRQGHNALCLLRHCL